MDTDPGTWSPRRFLAALGVVAVATRLPVFLQPFLNGDEATYHALASAMLDGHWLYAGAVDHKPPLIATTYAAVLGVCGRYSLHSVHALSIAVVVLTGMLICALATRLGFSVRAGRLAALLYVISAAMGPGFDMLAANSELFMALPSAAAMVLIAGAVHDDRMGGLGGLSRLSAQTTLAGVCITLAALYKYQGAAVLAPVLLLTWRLRTGRRRLAATAALCIGAALPIGCLVLLYAGAGHLDALRFWAWAFPLRYAGSLDATTMAANGAVWSLAWSASNAALLAAAWLGLREDKNHHAEGDMRPALVVWVLASAVGVAAGGRFFLHYYLQLLPPLSVLAGVGAYHLFSQRAIRRLAQGAVILPLSGFWLASAADPLVRREVARDTMVYRAVASVLRAHAGPRDTLFVWGNSSQIYVFARMPMGTRFPFCNYQSGKMWGTPADRDGAPLSADLAVEASWAMLLDDLERREPTWIVDAAEAGLDRWRGHEIARYPRLADRVARDYEIVARPNGATVYRRRGELAVRH